MLIIEKEGVFLHGVFGVFPNTSYNKAYEHLLLCASKDQDDYHEWHLRQMDNEAAIDFAETDPIHETLDTTTRSQALEKLKRLK